MSVKWISCMFILLIWLEVSTTSNAKSNNEDLFSNQSIPLNSVSDDSVIEHKLLPLDRINADNGQFGYSISVDGNRMLVGAYNASESGLVYVYEFSDDKWNEVAVLNNSSQNTINQFGYSVSLSGNRAIVGAPKGSGGGSEDTSAVHVFDLINGDWQESQVFFPSENLMFSRFGESVSLGIDRVLIGSPNERFSAGAAYIYDYRNGNWELTQKLQSNDVQSSDNFGRSVSLWNNSAVISAPYDDDLGSGSGSAYIFSFDGLAWQQTEKIVAEDGFAGEGFGNRVDIDQQRLVVGTNLATNAVSNNSFVYVFESESGNWLQTHKLTAGSIDSGFGASVNLNGNRLAIGATSYPFCCDKTGAVFLYEFINNSWVQQQLITPESGSNSDQFGSSVVIADNQILVGASGHDGGAINSGSVFYFTHENNDWVENDYISIKNHGRFQNFGRSVKLDGSILMSGAPGKYYNQKFPGSVYVFYKNTLSWMQTQEIVASDATAGDYFGFAISLEGTKALISAPKDFVSNAVVQGVVYFFELIDGEWIEQQIIRPSDPAVGDLFGYSLTMFGDYAVIGAPGYFDDLTAGSAYVFKYLNNSWQEVAKIQAPDGQLGDGFGLSLDLYQNNLLIGAPFQSSSNHINSGSAYVYKQINESWQYKQKLVTAGGDGFYYGLSVSFLKDDILIGRPGDGTAGQEVGAVYTYQLLEGSWVQQNVLVPDYYNGLDWFGHSISSDDNRVVVGTFQPYDTTLEYSFVYHKINNDWQQTTKLTHDFYDYEGYGFAVDIDGKNIAVGAPQSKIHGSESGSTYVYEFDLIFKDNFE